MQPVPDGRGDGRFAAGVVPVVPRFGQADVERVELRLRCGEPRVRVVRRPAALFLVPAAAEGAPDH
eukprot:2351031-Lingulodinium_polyedra.AAC.1